MNVLCRDGVYLNVLGIPPADFKKVAEVVARDGFQENADIMAKVDPNQFAELPAMLARRGAARPRCPGSHSLPAAGAQEPRHSASAPWRSAGNWAGDVT